MKTFIKSLVIGTMPAVLAGNAIAAVAASGASTAPAATQPATQPTTQPAPENLANSDTPLIIPDGTSREHPGPSQNPVWQGQTMIITGIRQ